MGYPKDEDFRDRRRPPTDKSLVDEADNHKLNSYEATMLESMRKQVEAGRTLTLKQRGWLANVIETRPVDHGEADVDYGE